MSVPKASSENCPRWAFGVVEHGIPPPSQAFWGRSRSHFLGAPPNYGCRLAALDAKAPATACGPRSGEQADV